MNKKKIIKLFIYLFCFAHLVGSLILIFIIFLSMIMFGGIILYEFNSLILNIEFISVIISFIILPFLCYDLFLRKEIYE